MRKLISKIFKWHFFSFQRTSRKAFCLRFDGFFYFSQSLSALRLVTIKTSPFSTRCFLLGLPYRQAQNLETIFKGKLNKPFPVAVEKLFQRTNNKNKNCLFFSMFHNTWQALFSFFLIFFQFIL